MKRLVCYLLLGFFSFVSFFIPSALAQDKNDECVWTSSDSLQAFTDKINLDEVVNPDFVEVYIDTKTDTVSQDGESVALEDVFDITASEKKKIFSSASAAVDYFAETEYNAEKIDDDRILVTDEYSSCRILVLDADLSESYGAVEVHVFSKWNESVLVFSSPEDTRTAYASLREEYGEDRCWCDRCIPINDTSISDDTSGSSDSWSYQDMGFDVVQQADIIKTGEESLLNHKVRIAIIDSGIAKDHEAFDDCTISGESYDFIRGTSTMSDKQGHGTAVASVIAEATPSNVEIIMLKVNNSTSETLDSIAIYNALQYAADLDIDILNMSFGGEGDADEYDSEFAALDKNNVVMIAAAGNESINVRYSTPANSSYTIAVSATDKNRSLAYFSNYGNLIDFAAPGVDVRVADIDTGGYTKLNGTSFSSPLLCSAAAYVRMLYPESTGEEVYEELISTSIDLGTKGKDTSFGYGMPVLTDYLGEVKDDQEKAHIWKKGTAITEDKLCFVCSDCGETLECDSNCGKQLVWDWQDNILYIKGKGSMDEYQTEKFPWAFLSSQITKVVIASTVTEITDGAFSGLDSLVKFETVDGGAFQTNGSLLYSADGSVLYSAIKNSGSLLSVNCKVIRPYALSNCTKLRKLVLGACQIQLMNHAFDGCTKLEELYCWGSPDNWDSNVFSGKTLIVYREKSMNDWTSAEKKYGGNIQWKSYYHKVSDWVVSYQKEWEYTGSNIRPKIQVDAGDLPAVYTLDYETEESSEFGEYPFTLTSDSSFFEGKATYSYVIKGLSQNMKVSMPFSTLYVGKEMTLEVESVGIASFKSSNSEIISVSTQGVVTAKKAGTAMITVTAAKYLNYEPETVKVKISVKLQTTEITKLQGNSGEISLHWKAVNGASSYYIYRRVSNGSWRKIGVSDSLQYSDRITESKNRSVYYRVCAYDNGVSGGLSSARKIVVVTVPANFRVTRSSSGRIKMVWSQNKVCTGYQIQYTQNKKFSAGTTVKLSGSGKSTLTVKGLKKNRICYIRVRSYKGMYYSAWKTVKIKVL